LSSTNAYAPALSSNSDFFRFAFPKQQYKNTLRNDSASAFTTFLREKGKKFLASGKKLPPNRKTGKPTSLGTAPKF